MDGHTKRKRAQEELAKSLFGPGTDIDHIDERPEGTYLYDLDEKYPDVPHHYQVRWKSSDENLPQDDEWKDTLDKTIAAATKVIETCQMLRQRTEQPTTPMTPRLLKRTEDTIRYGVHQMEDLFTALRRHYRLPSFHNYLEFKTEGPAADYLPQVLLNNAEQILIWMPPLPTIKLKRKTDPIYYRELSDLLFNTTFQRMRNWHCNFIHAFHPMHTMGVADVDNYAYKEIIDLLAIVLSAPDSFDHFSCSMINYPSNALKPGCYLYICDRSKMLDFLRNFEQLAAEIQPQK